MGFLLHEHIDATQQLLLIGSAYCGIILHSTYIQPLSVLGLCRSLLGSH